MVGTPFQNSEIQALRQTVAMKLFRPQTLNLLKYTYHAIASLQQLLKTREVATWPCSKQDSSNVIYD